MESGIADLKNVEEDKLTTRERSIKTKPITFHRALAELGIAERADIYDASTKESYTMGELCKKYGKPTTRDGKRSARNHMGKAQGGNARRTGGDTG
eukprot:1643492-Pleurochrysis_carterae.AAC.2